MTGGRLTAGNFFLSLTGTLFIFCLSVYLVLNFRQIYYFDIDFLGIGEEAGLGGQAIRENYDALVDYNLVTKQVEELRFPSFPVSDTGRIHFQEVRRIFFAVQYAGAASLLVFAAGFAWKWRRRDFGCLRLMAVFPAVICLLIGTAMALDWQDVFIRFHELFFQNDYWLFDPAADPVITILPDEFFFHCAAAILLFVLIGCIMSEVFYRILTRRRRRKWILN